jgi:hypothetical protein
LQRKTTILKEDLMNKKFLLAMVATLAAVGAWAGEPSSFDVVMEHYEPIRLALIGDSMEGVNDHGEAIEAELRALDADFSSARAGATGEALNVVREKLSEIISAAEALADATSLEAARDGLYALSKPMVRWREGVSENGRPAVAYCPMHKRSWLQPGEEIGNPYGGMPRCGSVVSR